MALELDFIISDESVNRYGFRIISEGINSSNFLKNPVCLVSHRDAYLSVGKWKNIRVENGVLKGTVEFDEEDTDAVKIYKKYKNGYMSAVSISVLPLTESTDAEFLMPGQKYPTIVTSELLEISLVNVPGNANAVKLMGKNGDIIKLSLINHSTMSKEEKTIEELKRENEQLCAQRAKDLVKLHLNRGVITHDVVGFFEKNAIDDYDATKLTLERMPTPEGSQNSDAPTQLAKQLVEMHFKRGACSAEEVSFYENAAVLDYDTTKKILEAKRGTEGLQDVVKNLTNGTSTPGSEDRSKWSYLDWYKKDLSGLTKMQSEKPDEHKKLLDAYTLSLQRDGVIIKDGIES